jgi:hypothetical protein
LNRVELLLGVMQLVDVDRPDSEVCLARFYLMGEKRR